MPAQPTSFTLTWQEMGKVLEDANEHATVASLVGAHSRFVFKVAYGVLRNSHDAEDVVQEVFLRVHRSGTKGVVDMQAWLARIAFRLAVDRLRKPAADELGNWDPPTSEADAERLAIHRQRVHQVRRLVAALPDELRYPLVLSAIEEMNSRQIAEIIGIPESSVRGRIARARQWLREKLAAITEVKP